METFVTFENPRVKMVIPGGPLHDDKIEVLSGMDLYKVNAAASEAVKNAHIDGGVPVLELTLPQMSANSFGALAYFFKRSCAISSIISGVSPFGQPGVEAYKNNIYAILGMKK
jgi:glucose-6-phosphate isomerase